MIKKKSLGKGLGALISDSFEDTIDQSTHQMLEIDINDITPNELQPRKRFNQDELKALSVSIERNGIIQPLILRPIKKGYEIIAGERRWRAAKMVALNTVPAIIMDPDEQKLYEMALIENMQRVNLNPIEEAIAYHSLIEEFKMTQNEVANIVGKSRSHVTNTIRLLQLEESVKDYIINGELSAGHTKILVGIPDKVQLSIAQQIIDHQLSVRETEALIKKLKQPKQSKYPKTDDALIYKPYINTLEDYLGSKVKISSDGNHGRVVISFYDEDDFERLYQLICK